MAHNNNSLQKMKSNSSLKRASLPATLDASSLTRNNESASTDYVPPIRRPRTSEDFYMFCQLILEHENYEPVRKADTTVIKPELPPLDNKKEVHKVEDMEIEDMNIKQDPVIEQKPLLTVIPEIKTEEMNGNVTKVENAISSLQLVSSPIASPTAGDATSTNNSNNKRKSKSKSTKPTKMITTTTNTSSSSKNGYAASADESDDSDHDVEAYDLITCYCRKPFAGRPMIECSRCMTWLHMNCAKVRRNNIPEIFYCFKCQDEMRDTDEPEKSSNTAPETSTTASTTTTLNGRKKNGDYRKSTSPAVSPTPKSSSVDEASEVSPSTSYSQLEQKSNNTANTKMNRKVKNNSFSNNQILSAASSQAVRNNNNLINKSLTLNGNKNSQSATLNNYSGGSGNSS